MKNKNKKIILTLMAVIGLMMCFTQNIYAAPNNVDLPQLNISLGDGSGSPQEYVSSIKILIFFTIISLMPSSISITGSILLFIKSL